MDYKEIFLNDFFHNYRGQKIKILDIGSGTSLNFVKILKNNPDFQYVGIEYRDRSIIQAKKNLAGLNFKIIRGFGESNSELIENDFDVVISLSVLEHVKYLDDFLIKSAMFLKKGGKLIHRYDLGHAIYPSTTRENIKVFLCKNFPFLISKKHFTTYPSLKKIKNKLSSLGFKNIEVSQHQMRSLKLSVNILKNIEKTDELIIEISNLEKKIYDLVKDKLNDKERDYLFPVILISCDRK